MNTNFIILKSSVMKPYTLAKSYDSIADEFLKLIWIWVLLVYHNHPHLSCIWMLHCITYFSMQPIAFDSWALSSHPRIFYNFVNVNFLVPLPQPYTHVQYQFRVDVDLWQLVSSHWLLPGNEGHWLAGSPDDTTSHVVHLSQCMQYAATNVNNALTAS